MTRTPIPTQQHSPFERTSQEGISFKRMFHAQNVKGMRLDVIIVKRLAGITALLCMYWFFYLREHSSSTSWICKYPNAKELIMQSVWSHRGYQAGGEADASSAAISILRKHDIVKFDVDVIVHFEDKSRDEYQFYVSHPSRFDIARRDEFQTLDSFLDNLSEYLSSSASTIHSKQSLYASLEPKFINEKDKLQKFMSIINDKNPLLLGHIAIIVRFPWDMKLIDSIAAAPIWLGIALRSQNIVDGELWSLEKKKISSEVFQMKRRVIFMPDIKLWNDNSDVFENIQHVSEHQLVSWLVDDEISLQKVINFPSKIEFISNCPVDIAQRLKNIYDRQC